MARRIDVTLEGLHQLLHRIERKELVDGDWAICGALVLQLITRIQGKQERMAAKLAASASAAPSASVVDVLPSMTGASTALPPESGSDTGAEQEQTSDAATSGQEKKAKGHGRNGASAFVNAKHFLHALAAGLVGALCSACGLGRMTRYREKVIIRVVGQPLFAAELHHLEQARCRVCGRIVRAEAPTGVCEGLGSSYTVYDWSACAMLAVMHYFAAAPFKRLEALHEGWGIPLPDANLWRLVDESDDLLLPLYRALELHGVQNATSLRIDDTGSMVVALARQIQAEVEALERLGESTRSVRTGINATGVLLEMAQGSIVLFFTGRHHAGEILDRLLKRRMPGGPRLVKVTDGASKNFDHQHRGELVEATCNAHAFLKFHDLKDKHPTEYALAGEVYKGVFDNDDEAKARRLTPDERMLFHRERSKPLMEKLKAVCEERLRGKLVEPTSALWEPLSFIINQWSRLTRFYEEPGVPLDTNLVEQKLIIPVRYLAASFNYQTETGAEVGDRMMSLIATAHANGIEPVAYLTHCLRNHEDLSRRPADYLPWAYRDRDLPRAGTGPPTQWAQPAG
jgi:transposase